MLAAPKTIIISGTGRNVGKTTYALELIRKYIAEGPIAIKISSHAHNQTHGMRVIEVNDDFGIWQEDGNRNNKDSSKMAAAGASLTYYIEAQDKFLPKVLEVLNELIDFNKRIIIESAAIRRYLIPQEFVLIYSEEYPNIKPQNIDIAKFISRKVLLT